MYDFPTRLHGLLPLFVLLLGWFCLVPVTGEAQDGPTGETAIAIHGGAGSMSPDEMSQEREQAYRASLEAALQEGNIAIPFSTKGMFRAHVGTDGDTAVRIFDQADME